MGSQKCPYGSGGPADEEPGIMGLVRSSLRLTGLVRDIRGTRGFDPSFSGSEQQLAATEEFS